jgi:hypothetical protein
MDLYALALRRGLAAAGLLTAELRDDCRGCGACRYLLASLPDPNASSDSESSQSSSSSHRSMSESETETESEKEREESRSRSDASMPSVQGRLRLLFREMRV